VRRRTAAILARYSERAREAIWQAWLRHPDDERWELLTRYRGEQALASTALAAVTDPARAATARSAIGTFCVRRGIVPAGDAERALFYLMAGQPEQHRAADPDGSALAAAYRAAAEPVRAALRAAMADAGDLDLVRVVATRGATEAERGYLAAELARRRDWPRLWRLALDLPLAEAVAAARRLPADWRSAGEAGRQLLARLAAASEAEIAALATSAVTRLPAGRDIARYCRFAPDGSEMVVTWWRAYRRHGVRPAPAHHETVLYGLPGERQLEAFLEANDFPFGTRALHFGAGVVFSHRDSGNKPHLIRYVRGHGLDELTDYELYARFPMLAWVPAGFVVAVGGRLLLGTAEPGSPLRDVTPSGLGVERHTGLITHVVSEPRTGRIAIVITHPEHVPDSVAVLGPGFRVLGHADVPEADGPPIKDIGFCGPERLITCDERTGRLRSWRADPPLAAEAETVLSSAFPERVQPLPSAGLIVIDTKATIDDAGALRPDASDVYTGSTRYFREYLDAGTLRPVACPAVLEWARQPREMSSTYHGLDLSADGGHAALFRWLPNDRNGHERRELEVRDLVRDEISELVRRPLARSRPADLAAVTDLLAGRVSDPAVVTVLGLLRACLEHRFGADVAVSDQPPTLSADDVGLSPTALER
jgi:hypothetical protein